MASFWIRPEYVVDYRPILDAPVDAAGEVGLGLGLVGSGLGLGLVCFVMQMFSSKIYFDV